MLFGLVGYGFVKFGIPQPPFIIGFILGPMAETNLRRGLMLSDGSILPFFTRPICIFFLLFILVLVVPQLPFWPKVKSLFQKEKKAA